MYRVGYRALYSEVLMIHKSIFVLNLIQFYFDIPMPMITTLSEHTLPYSTFARLIDMRVITGYDRLL